MIENQKEDNVRTISGHKITSITITTKKKQHKFMTTVIAVSHMRGKSTSSVKSAIEKRLEGKRNVKLRAKSQNLLLGR